MRSRSAGHDANHAGPCSGAKAMPVRCRRWGVPDAHRTGQRGDHGQSERGRRRRRGRPVRHGLRDPDPQVGYAAGAKPTRAANSATARRMRATANGSAGQVHSRWNWATAAILARPWCLGRSRRGARLGPPRCRRMSSGGRVDCLVVTEVLLASRSGTSRCYSSRACAHPLGPEQSASSAPPSGGPGARRVRRAGRTGRRAHPIAWRYVEP